MERHISDEDFPLSDKMLVFLHLHTKSCPRLFAYPWPAFRHICPLPENPAFLLRYWAPHARSRDSPSAEQCRRSWWDSFQWASSEPRGGEPFHRVRRIFWASHLSTARSEPWWWSRSDLMGCWASKCIVWDRRRLPSGELDSCCPFSDAVNYYYW